MNKLKLLIPALAIFLFSLNANATYINAWTVAGPSSPTANMFQYNTWDLSYDSKSNLGSPVTFTASAVAQTAGDYTFAWNYTGFHAFFRVTAFLNTSLGDILVNAGPNNCCTTPSNGFGYSGLYTFSNVGAGDTISFTFGGDNQDSNTTIRGNLRLTHVTAPSVVAIILLAMGGMFVRKVYKK